jgi:hypothetical protein
MHSHDNDERGLAPLVDDTSIDMLGGVRHGLRRHRTASPAKLKSSATSHWLLATRGAYL